MNNYPVRIPRGAENTWYEVSRMSTNDILFDDNTSVQILKPGDRALVVWTGIDRRSVFITTNTENRDANRWSESFS